jgi:hypothetical protein
MSIRLRDPAVIIAIDSGSHINAAASTVAGYVTEPGATREGLAAGER